MAPRSSLHLRLPVTSNRSHYTTGRYNRLQIYLKLEGTHKVRTHAVLLLTDVCKLVDALEARRRGRCECFLSLTLRARCERGLIVFETICPTINSPLLYTELYAALSFFFFLNFVIHC